MTSDAKKTLLGDQSLNEFIVNSIIASTLLLISNAFINYLFTPLAVDNIFYIIGIEVDDLKIGRVKLGKFIKSFVNLIIVVLLVIIIYK